MIYGVTTVPILAGPWSRFGEGRSYYDVRGASSRLWTTRRNEFLEMSEPDYISMGTSWEWRRGTPFITYIIKHIHLGKIWCSYSDKRDLSLMTLILYQVWNKDFYLIKIFDSWNSCLYFLFYYCNQDSTYYFMHLLYSWNFQIGTKWIEISSWRKF
jgi:hypothetical protein